MGVELLVSPTFLMGNGNGNMDESRDVLPDDLRPTHNSLKLSGLCTHEPWTYQGQVDIVLEVRRATRVVTFNSHELRLHRAQIAIQNGSDSDALVHDSTKITYDAPLERCTVNFDVDLDPSAHEIVLSLHFEGCMNEYMAGFYRSEYTSPDSELMYMFSTQFEPSEARRAFPCFDEPALKATFDFEIEVPWAMTALSNMPVKASRPSGDCAIVTFQRSPRMSTYLLSWAIGHFEFIEQLLEHKGTSQNYPIRVYTTQGLSEHGKRGLQVACEVMDYFSEMFDIKYPLPKLDLIAVHEMSDDAMENWGLVTFRPTAILYNERESDPSYISYMTYIIAHELAHQWFGNLSTMPWWDELWLNEGFATWAGWCACDHLHPEWNVWATFAAEDMRTAFDLDGLRSSHPIQVPIPDGREVDAIFDSISYLKSAAVIRMLAARLGLPTFLRGVSEYLKANAYGNATAVALWEALEKVSGEKVTAIMTPWIQDVGYPVLTVSDVVDDQIHLRQDRFLSSGEPSPDESMTTWWLPIKVHSPEGTRQIDLTRRNSVMRNVDAGTFYRLNANQIGFYLTQLPDKEFERLCDKIDEASIQDQVGLLSDVATLAMSGFGATTTAAVLTLVSHLRTLKQEYPIFSIVLSCVERIQSIFSDDQDLSHALDRLTADVIGPVSQDLGWSVKPSESHLTIKSRSLVLSAAGLAGHTWTVINGLQLWDNFREHRDARVIHPSLRRAVFSIAMRYRGLEAFDILREEYDHSAAPDSREIIVEAMSKVATADLANKCLTFAFQGGMTSSDSGDLMMNLARNSTARETVWAFMRENWPLIDRRLGGSSAVMEPLVRHSLQTFATQERRADIEAFFRDKDTTGYTRGLKIALECISINAAYRERDNDVVRSWLRKNGYL